MKRPDLIKMSPDEIEAHQAEQERVAAFIGWSETAGEEPVDERMDDL